MSSETTVSNFISVQGSASLTVAQAAAAYRKRRGDKIARYEAALKAIADPGSVLCHQRVQEIARNALNPEPPRLHRNRGE